jgi:hypothetical protein
VYVFSSNGEEVWQPLLPSNPVQIQDHKGSRTAVFYANHGVFDQGECRECEHWPHLWHSDFAA